VLITKDGGAHLGQNKILTPSKFLLRRYFFDKDELFKTGNCFSQKIKGQVRNKIKSAVGNKARFIPGLHAGGGGGQFAGG